MAYTAQTWVDGNATYPLSAARMSNIENGLVAAAGIADVGHRALTTAQRDGLASVTAGTMIYNTTLGRIQVYNGSAWVAPDQVSLNPVCLLRKNAAQSIPNTTWTSLTFGAGEELYDTNGWHDTTTNTARITPNIAGLYVLTANNYWASGTTSGARIMKNGSTYIAMSESTGGQRAGESLSVMEFMNGTTDYVTFDVYQSSGGALNTSTAAYPNFQAAFLGNVT